MSDDHLRELGRDLPWDRPDEARRDAVRSSLLVEAGRGDVRPPTRWYLVGGAFATGALAAAAAILFVMRGAPPSAAPSAAQGGAQIEASASADFERHVARTAHGADEVVRVHAGKLDLSVGALPIGDRVRIATRDAEVEGEGTYEVSVAGDQLREVIVKQGRATVRVGGQQAVFLATGETWQASVVTASVELAGSNMAAANAEPRPADVAATVTPPTRDESPRSADATLVDAPRHEAPAVTRPEPAPSRAESAAARPVAAPEPAAPADSSPATTEPAPPTVAEPAPEASAASAPTPRATPAGPTDIEKHFEAGWRLLKAGKAAEAARELGAAADAGGDDALAIDARYFEAVALTKAGRKTEAEHALVAFLDHAKQSLRRGRAAVMLARLIAERGDAKSARAWFESALSDPDPGVVAAARAGLAKL